MSKHDQCPSSHKEGKPVHATPVGVAAEAERRASATGVVAGRQYWRGLEDRADTAEFRDWMEREFPSGASELALASEGGQETRRHFLKIMGAGLALAGAATMPACRRPEHNILPYAAKVPEDIIPGKALFYATSMALPGGGAEGLLIETHEGRPTKVEGNPLHPINQGKASLWSLSSILSLYDPDRLKHPELVRTSAGAATEATWDDFAAWSRAHFAQFDATKGAGLVFVCDKSAGPTRDAMKAKVLAKWPSATWIAYDACEDAQALAGLRGACGKAVRELPDLAKARVIVAVERDFLQFESGSLAHARGLGASRAPMKPTDQMSRLYAVESCFSTTGASADHRLCLRPSQSAGFVVLLAEKLAALLGSGAGARELAAAVAAVKGKVDSAGVDAKFVEAAAEDLAGAKGAGLLLTGRAMPSWAHALGALINTALGAPGTSVRYIELGEQSDGAIDSTRAFADLVRAIDAGQVKTIVTLNVNPCFNVAGFEQAYAKVGTRIALSNDLDETSHGATWRLNGATYLESWGDTRAADGTVAPVQPMIAPLFGGKSEVETLAIIAGEKVTDGYEIVRATWRALGVVKGDFEKGWRRALFDGVLAGSGAGATVTPSASRAAEAVAGLMGNPPAPAGSLEVVFAVTAMGDGRWANNAWLQELPDPVARVVWDNPMLISPATAKKLGLARQDYTEKKPRGEMVSMALAGGAVLKVCAWVVPGVADDTLVLTLGNGRRVTGLVGTGVGFDVDGVRPAGVFASRATGVTSTGEKYEVSSTQLHGSMEGRAIVREMDLAAYAKHGGAPIVPETDAYGRQQKLTLAERLDGSEMTHMPALKNIYPNPYNASHADPDATVTNAYDPRRAGKTGGFGKPAFAVSPQWGMSIDLSSCTGCNVCTIACQSENNIPVVGKIEVNKGREMQWIRIDRYFTSEQQGQGVDGATGMVFQPVACVHCENAPCEVVCPVNATVHGPEGHNYMVYNRCIGTRYCANNCPYKVRRFNFFDYGVTKFNGGLDDGISDVTPDAIEKNLPANQSLIPPRLRKKLDEIAKLQKNPNVTVRSRGVMEKCTYCIQRTNEAKIELKIKGLRKNDEGVPDGYVQTACQQACPTGAIVFGDILDTKSRVHEAREHHRTYALLGYLNVRPRTTYMARVLNPNPKLRAPVADPFGHGHGGDGHAKPAGEGKGHTYLDRKKLHTDDGYRLSLAVLGGEA